MIGWRFFVGGTRTAAEQMACDDALAQETAPTVRLFLWDPPAFSLGRKQPRPDWLGAGQASYELVERPTGGGIAVHGSDLSLAVVVPRACGVGLERLMRAVCESAATLCRTSGAEATARLDGPGAQRVTYCLAEASPYAVVVRERKVAGFALRRYPDSWLIQGSLLVQAIPRALRDAMPPEVRRRFELRAVPLAHVAPEAVDGIDLARRWADQWSSWWDEVIDTHATKEDILA